MLKLGVTPGAYTVSVSASYNSISLTGSPVIFSATAITPPALLQLASADSASGLAGAPLSEPLRVRVTDLTGYPVPNHPVTFWVRRGGGNLEGQTEIVKISDANGVVSVIPTLGSAIGAANNVFEAQSFQEAGLHLSGSPRRFYVSAKKSLAYQIFTAGGNGLSAQAGEVLPQLLAVRVVDKAQQPAAGQEVLFTVVKGSGKLGAGQTSAATVQSNAAGIAQISFRLGSEVGSQVHAVRASADDGVAALINSPLTFTASAPFGQPDTSASTISVTSPVVADGVSEAEVRIRLVDAQDHPVPGERLTLLVSGNGNQITQPELPTDAQGQSVAQLRSTVAESKIIRVYISSKNIYLKEKAAALFTAGTPQRIVMVSGDFQTGIIQSALEKPVIVRLEDFYQNPIANAALDFTPALGSGETAPKQGIITDAAGQAQIAWILGPSVGLQEMEVRAAGTSISRQVSATAVLPQQIQMIKSKGDGQFAAPGAFFPTR